MAQAELVGLLDLLRLRGLLRAYSHVETLAAADIVNGLDTGRDINVRSLPGQGGAEWVVVTRIQAQGIRPSNLTIVARDLNRHAFRLMLRPDLTVDDVPLIGEAAEGITLTVRNNAAKTVDLTIHAAVLSREQMREVLGVAGLDRARRMIGVA
jgi:hypothetical protein